jgi:tetratricopeptide (TPR) repeat protein
VFRAADFREQVAYVLSILGRTASRAGRHEEATVHLEEALRLGQEAGEQRFEVAVSGFLAEAAVRRGDPDVALDFVDRASVRASLTGGPGIYEALLERTSGCALIALGELKRAEDALERSLAAARATRSEYDEALALQAMVWLSEETGGAVPVVDGAGATAIFARLGVVSTNVVALRPRVVSV